MAPTIALEQFTLGTLLPSLFAFVLLYVLRWSSNVEKSHWSKKNHGLVVAKNDDVTMNLATKDDSGIDVIIVGAGVAGAALAHTLGKASQTFIGSLICFSPNFIQIRVLLNLVSSFTSISGNFLERFLLFQKYNSGQICVQ